MRLAGSCAMARSSLPARLQSFGARARPRSAPANVCLTEPSDVLCRRSLALWNSRASPNAGASSRPGRAAAYRWHVPRPGAPRDRRRWLRCLHVDGERRWPLGHVNVASAGRRRADVSDSERRRRVGNGCIACPKMRRLCASGGVGRSRRSPISGQARPGTCADAVIPTVHAPRPSTRHLPGPANL